MKRTSLSEYDARRIYEWRLALNQGIGESCCEHCDVLEKRIADFIGKKDASWLRKLVKKHPYFPRNDA